MGESATTANRKRNWYRKSLVIPTEHGSWSWLLVPYFVGLIVAGQLNLEVVLVFVGGLAAFFVRQPLTAWLRIRAGQGRRSDGPIAAAWTLGFGGIATASLIGLLISGAHDLIWLLPPIAGLFILYLAAARHKRASIRTLSMEVAGAAGLAAMAPAAYIASAGLLDNLAWALWILTAAQNTLGVLYVRLRLADTHGRTTSKRPTITFHVAILVGLLLAAWGGGIPSLAILPFIGYLGRALWAAARARPVNNIKRFGFIEVGVEIVGGLIIAASWLI